MDRPSQPDTEAGRSTVDTVMSLLGAFDERHRVMGVRELARRSGIPRSTAHRAIGQLVAWGALERTDDGVQIGVRLFEIGTLAPTHARLREAALPYAHHLAEFTRLTVNLAVREGSQIVYLEKITQASHRVSHTRLGGRGDAHATGLGKALLAFASASEIDAVLSQPLRPVTPHTIVDPALLRRDLAATRARRVAFDLEESRAGLFCVASPILDAAGAPIAAISVTGATTRAQVEEHAGALRTAALAIGRAVAP
ncbi:IclR family transcriptional regulator [Microbacterium limosum]|uniref:IclR family transcriptional regulator n=1 Tax=Microbacterium limosum TaxID=3079935 RepID=A0AAU0MJN2_9MICO|nr:IclR family transcriptional regulator [Microbacterium sp. Y20]WOQ69977.1 IclR family transcriptional regulator [Microbacterium sp. Y20]